jgi:hypothetical protein
MADPSEKKSKASAAFEDALAKATAGIRKQKLEDEEKGKVGAGEKQKLGDEKKAKVDAGEQQKLNGEEKAKADADEQKGATSPAPEKSVAEAAVDMKKQKFEDEKKFNADAEEFSFRDLTAAERQQLEERIMAELKAYDSEGATLEFKMFMEEKAEQKVAAGAKSKETEKKKDEDDAEADKAEKDLGKAKVNLEAELPREEAVKADAGEKQTMKDESENKDRVGVKADGEMDVAKEGETNADAKRDSNETVKLKEDAIKQHERLINEDYSDNEGDEKIDKDEFADFIEEDKFEDEVEDDVLDVKVAGLKAAIQKAIASHCASNDSCASDEAIDDVVNEALSLAAKVKTSNEKDYQITDIDDRLPYRQGWPLLSVLPVLTSHDNIPKILSPTSGHAEVMQGIVKKEHRIRVEQMEVLHRHNPGTSLDKSTLTLCILATEPDNAAEPKWPAAIRALRNYITSHTLTLAVEIIDHRVFSGMYTHPILPHETTLKTNIKKKKNGVVNILDGSGLEWTSLEFWWRGMGRMRCDCKPTVLIGTSQPQKEGWWGAVKEKVQGKMGEKWTVEVCYREGKKH